VKAGYIEIAANISGTLLVLIGKVAALIQTIILVQNTARSLGATEKAMLRRVFKNSISYYNVRIIEGGTGIFSLANTAFVIGNTIFLPGKKYISNSGLLVHECVHVWQYQHRGCRYTFDALWAQYHLGRIPGKSNAYNWQAEISRGWEDINAEAQAQLIEDNWEGMVQNSAASKSLSCHSGLIKAGFQILQNSRCFRVSRLITYEE
jgi:hypothetical protein